MIKPKGKSNIFTDFVGKANIYLNAEENKEKAIAYVYIILSLFTLAIFGIFAIGPTITTITELNKEHEENKRILDQLNQKVTNLSLLRSQYSQIQPDFPLIESAVPSTPNASKLTRQIELVSSTNSLAIEKIDIGLLEIFPASNVNTPIFAFSFSVSVNGSRENINNFVKEIVNVDRIVGVDRLTINEESGSFNAVVAGKSYYYR